jgi:RimJ/RimL family protein N-acetyltransferase
MDKIAVRPIAESDFENIVDYFLKADKDFLAGMGVDTTKLPKREDWLKLLVNEYRQPLEKKQFFYVIWLQNNIPVGHSNINKIIFAKEAYMHLHMWGRDNRRKGAGLEFIKMSLPHYFSKFELQTLYCEPYALNPAPNKTLEKAGFEFIKTYDTTPGWINFHQSTNRWRMDLTKYKSLFGAEK